MNRVKGEMFSKRLNSRERRFKEIFCLKFSGLFCVVAVEDCHAHLWQADTLGILPVIIIAVWPYCSLAEHISRESEFRDSWCL